MAPTIGMAHITGQGEGKDYGIDYDPVNDYIVLSAPIQNEVWVIDHGTTTAEAKSGYGLNLEDELKQLETIRTCSERQPVELVPTLLAQASRAGLRVASFGVPGTWPPEPEVALGVAGFDSPRANDPLACCGVPAGLEG